MVVAVGDRITLAVPLEERYHYRVISDAAPPGECGQLNCPACGAPCNPDRRLCEYCGNHLAAIRCSGCSTLHFAGAVLCTRCGRQLRPQPGLAASAGAQCPRCNHALASTTLGTLVASECGKCGGLFLDAVTLRQVVADREQARAVPFAPADKPVAVTDEVRYLRCPVCRGVMNRVNFGRRSGVIVDVCREHGTWFDAGELALTLEFVAQGGLAEAMRREREALTEARRETLRTPSTVAMAADTLWQNPSASSSGLLSLLSDLWRGLG